MMWSNRAVSRWLLTASVALGLAWPLGSALAGSYTLQGNELKLPGPVQFETASDKLRPESDAVLEVVAGYLKEKSHVSLLRIEAHSDNQGNAAQNQSLSENAHSALGAGWSHTVWSASVCWRWVLALPSRLPITARQRAGPESTHQLHQCRAAGRAIGGMPEDGGGHVAGDLCK